MDKVIQIFTQLGADQSIFYQFGIFILLFILLKLVLFNKLLFVLETRENKTTKMEELANTKFSQADKLSKDFDEQISATRITSVEKANEEKAVAAKKMAEAKSSKEKEIQAMYTEEKSKIEANFEVTKKNVMENVSNLSQDLVAKLAK
jgi:F0F1-type ATP synthase membrane subunit b/b'